MILAFLLLAGCKHAAVGVNNAHPAAPVHGNVNASGSVAAALIVGTAALAVSQELSNPQPMPSWSIFSDWTSRPAPVLAPERDVVEQDCTKPIDLSAGNLRCR